MKNPYIKTYIENPIKTIWKARKVFKFPKIKISFYYNLDFKNLKDKTLLSINCHDVDLKFKFQHIEMEEVPYISFLFFNIFLISFTLTYGFDYDTPTYEAMLDYLYNRNNRSIEQIVSDNTWKKADGTLLSCSKFIKTYYPLI